jgi:NADPH-dependent curcumin reductase CurA
MNRQIFLKSRPKGLPALSDFEMTETGVPTPADGELLVNAKFISVDPYMRSRMSDAKSYVPPFGLGEPMNGGVVAEVIESRHPDFEVGDAILAHLQWQEIQTVKAENATKLDNKVPLSYYLGILGMPGLTAYFGLLGIGKPVQGETVVVSGAAGAVGMVVCQIARLKGCRVVAIAGSDEKNAYLKNVLNVDAVINYHTETNIKAAVARACPDGVDVYYDNVGGEISDAVIRNIKKNARIVLCEQISVYNNTEIPVGPRPQPILVKKSALMQGFIVSNYSDRFGEGVKQLAQWLGEGKLTYRETIMQGFETLPESFIGLFHGKNTGKMLVEMKA